MAPTKLYTVEFFFSEDACEGRSPPVKMADVVEVNCSGGFVHVAMSDATVYSYLSTTVLAFSTTPQE